MRFSGHCFIMETGIYQKEVFDLSVLLCYTAKRDYPISAQEQKACRDVVERYNAEFPFRDLYESFRVYDLDTITDKNVIFEGATKLPTDGDHFIKAHNYWKDCLQEIIPHGQWSIHIDDTDVTPYFDYPE